MRGGEGTVVPPRVPCGFRGHWHFNAQSGGALPLSHPGTESGASVSSVMCCDTEAT